MKKTNKTRDYEQLFDPETKTKGDMNEIKKGLLLKPGIVPSAAMREFWEKEPWGFEDKGIAAIICNSDAPYGMKFETLMELGSITDDAELRESIGRCLYREMDLHIRQLSNDYSHAFEGEKFANAFVNMNTPFRKGDIVKATKDGSKHGILMSGGRIWSEDTLPENVLGSMDYGDVQFRVEWLDENGEFYHEHVNPLYLDYYVPEEGETDYEALTAASALVRGSENSSLQELQMACEAVKKNKEKEGKQATHES